MNPAHPASNTENTDLPPDSQTARQENSNKKAPPRKARKPNARAQGADKAQTGDIAAIEPPANLAFSATLNPSPGGSEQIESAPKRRQRSRRAKRGVSADKTAPAEQAGVGQTADPSDGEKSAEAQFDNVQKSKGRSALPKNVPDLPSEPEPDSPGTQSSTTAEAKPKSKANKGKPSAKTAKSGKSKGQDLPDGQEKAENIAHASKKRMLISVLPGEQVEVALAEDGQLLEYYLDMLHQCKLKGNIYKGTVHNIDANLQAAFVNYGTGKNGFLQIDEIHPEYWLNPHEPAKGQKFPPIQKVLKTGQEILVQVVKEPTGNKGAFLTTWLSLAGRFLVLTPGQEQIGVSRKVTDEAERNRLREMINGIDPGSGLGVIVRTVSAGTTKTNLKNDLLYLKRLWKDIRKKATEVSAPALIHQEPGLSERAVRDYLTEDVAEIWVDNDEEAAKVRNLAALLFPRKKDLVHLQSDFRQSIWDRFNLRRQLDQIYAREVIMPSGGRLVFDQTEALMAIDINSGKISGKGNFEAMAFKTNMEAAQAIARQLRLRDIGGQVVIDFIEMRDKAHIAEVEKCLRQAMKSDRARHDVGRMSSFGLLELVRQRMGSSALSITFEPCALCAGTGLRRNLEWQAIQAMRDLRRKLQGHSQVKFVYQCSAELGLYLLNNKREALRDMERDYEKTIEIAIQP